ncbi:MAG: adenine deaminase [Sarcina sp.]
MNRENFEDNLRVSTRLEVAEFVIKNINIIDVFSGETFISDVAINNGYIVGIGDYKGSKILDGTGKYICPTLIDAHTHIESSLLTPHEYAKVSIMHGITTVVADPHEIANVLGVKGIEYMIRNSKNLPMDFKFMLPSCVPATSFETSGANLLMNDLQDFYENEEVLGLAEVMDSHAVKSCDKGMIDKIYNSLKEGKVIDGHCAGFDLDLINLYATAKIVTDHESISVEEMIDKIRRGFYLFMRQGTAAKNLEILAQGVTAMNSRRVCLCTDDKHIDEFVAEGSIDNSIRLCIQKGIKPEIAIQMATLNTAECYGLKEIGAIAPGYKGNFIILDNLEEFKINSIYRNGKIIVKDNEIVIKIEQNDDIKFNNSVNFKNLEKEDLKIDIANKKFLNCIGLIPQKLETNHLKLEIGSLNLNSKNEFVADIDQDIIKLAVIERHHATGNIGLGTLKGLKITEGAIGSTIGHDSHNIIVAGANDEDMILVCNRLKEIGGGIVIAKSGQVLAEVTLEVAGLMTNRPIEEVLKDMKKLHDSLKLISKDLDFNPFLTLSFLTLPVIPDLKITDKGLFNFKEFMFVPVVE